MTSLGFSWVLLGVRWRSWALVGAVPAYTFSACSTRFVDQVGNRLLVQTYTFSTYSTRFVELLGDRLLVPNLHFFSVFVTSCWSIWESPSGPNLQFFNVFYTICWAIGESSAGPKLTLLQRFRHDLLINWRKRWKGIPTGEGHHLKKVEGAMASSTPEWALLVWKPCHSGLWYLVSGLWCFWSLVSGHWSLVAGRLPAGNSVAHVRDLHVLGRFHWFFPPALSLDHAGFAFLCDGVAAFSDP